MIPRIFLSGAIFPDALFSEKGENSAAYFLTGIPQFIWQWCNRSKYEWDSSSFFIKEIKGSLLQHSYLMLESYQIFVDSVKSRNSLLTKTCAEDISLWFFPCKFAKTGKVWKLTEKASIETNKHQQTEMEKRDKPALILGKCSCKLYGTNNSLG